MNPNEENKQPRGAAFKELLSKLYHFWWFYFTLILVGISSYIEGVYGEKPDGWTNILTIGLLAIPSVIHLWIWSRLLKQDVDNVFCKFFDFTMFFSVLSFTLPHILFNIIPYVSSENAFFDNKFLIQLSLCITVFFLVAMSLMIILVNYELLRDTKASSKNTVTNTASVTDSRRRRFYNTLKIPFNLDFLNWCFRIENLKVEMQPFPFWRTMHFFAIFLSTSYIFGFLFAFYDINLRATYNIPALIMEDVSKNYSNSTLTLTLPNNSDTTPPPAETRSDSPINQTGSIPAKSDNNSEEKRMPVCFYFPEGRANFEDNPLVLKGDDLSQTGQNERAIRKNYNDKALTKTVNFILSELLESSIDSSKPVLGNNILRIELNGYADMETLKSNTAFNSNFELSSARNISVKKRIYEELRDREFKGWRQLEWVDFPHSNEKDSSQMPCKLDAEQPLKGNAAWRMVEIYIRKTDDQQTQKIWENQASIIKTDRKIDKVLEAQGELFKKLEQFKTSNTDSTRLNPSVDNYRTPKLLDYLYFAIGVITTNAAGDVKPATPFARFLISVISFFQIFFIVGFFSTLLSLQKKDKSDNFLVGFFSALLTLQKRDKSNNKGKVDTSGVPSSGNETNKEEAGGADEIKS